MANPSEDIDLLVKIDDKIVFEDTLAYEPFKINKLKFNLRGGVYNLLVQSNKAGLSEDKTILILFNQHILVDYYPASNETEEQGSFYIKNSLSPFDYRR